MADSKGDPQMLCEELGNKHIVITTPLISHLGGVVENVSYIIVCV